MWLQCGWVRQQFYHQLSQDGSMLSCRSRSDPEIHFACGLDVVSLCACCWCVSCYLIASVWNVTLAPPCCSMLHALMLLPRNPLRMQGCSLLLPRGSFPLSVGHDYQHGSCDLRLSSAAETDKVCGRSCRADTPSPPTPPRPCLSVGGGVVFLLTYPGLQQVFWGKGWLNKSACVKAGQDWHGIFSTCCDRFVFTLTQLLSLLPSFPPSKLASPVVVSLWVVIG